MSFLALCGAITIFLSFRYWPLHPTISSWSNAICREMRCLRHKIHVGLFCAFGLSALNWIGTKSLPELAQYFFTVFYQVYCTSWVITFFFHLASFYWMFLEGIGNKLSVIHAMNHNFCRVLSVPASSVSPVSCLCQVCSLSYVWLWYHHFQVYTHPFHLLLFRRSCYQHRGVDSSQDNLL